MANKAKRQRPTVKMVRELENKLRANEIALEEFPLRVSQLQEQLAEKTKEFSSAVAQVEMYREEAKKNAELSAARKRRIAEMGHEINNAEVKIEAFERQVKLYDKNDGENLRLSKENQALTVVNEALRKDHIDVATINQQLHGNIHELRNKIEFRPGTGLITNDINRCIRLVADLDGDGEEKWAIIGQVTDEDGKLHIGTVYHTRSELSGLYALLHG